MPLDVAIQAVEAYLKLKPSFPNVRFGGGGEPTIEKHLIREVIFRFDKHGVYWSMITSGVMPEEFLNWLIEKRVNITFSVDGPPEIQDLHRPLRSSRGSSPIVEKNIKIYREKRNKLHVRCTLTKMLVEKLDEVLSYFEQLRVTMLSVELMYPMGRGMFSENSMLILSRDETLRSLIRVMEWGRQKGVTVRTIVLFHPSFVSDLTYCGPINGTAFVVNHQGYLLGCGEALDTEHPFWNIWMIGRLENSQFVIDEEKHKRLLEISSLDAMDGCRGCFARFVCRGGCPMRRLFQTGKINKPDPYHCYIAKRLLIALIIRMVEGRWDENLSGMSY